MNHSLRKLYNPMVRISIIVGCFYRPPDVLVAHFNNSLESIVSTSSFENKLSYLMGDFSINILNSQSHQSTNEFINLMLSNNSMYPLISKPTRIASSTTTLTDNIFTNNYWTKYEQWHSLNWFIWSPPNFPSHSSKFRC